MSAADAMSTWSLKRLVVVVLAVSVVLRCEASPWWGDVGDYNALLEFKDGFNDPGGLFSTWIQYTDCCKWEGVTCTADGRVSKLDLEPMYSPNTPPTRKLGYQNIVGQSLGDLDELEELILIGVIFDAPAPSSLGKLTRLTRLRLEGNRFTGGIPGTYGQMISLLRLKLSSGFSGSIPQELCNLVNVIDLDLSTNQLVDSIPPCLYRLVNLTELRMEGNALSGPIPPIIGSFGKLAILNLRGNQLTGRIPDELHHLWNLGSLNLASNDLSGTIPRSLGKLRNLFSIDLAQNRLIGLIPRELGSFPNLIFLSLYNNLLTGPIPPELARLPNIVSLILSQNRLSGTIPGEFGKVPARNKLQLDVASNRLNGVLPKNLCNLASLRAQDNSLKGSFPLCLTAVETVVLSNNLLTSLSHYDSLPKGVKLDLTTLKLDNNRIYGRIPTWLNPTLSKLKDVDLSQNKMTGDIPIAFLSMPHLSKVNVSNNQLNSHLPNRVFFSKVDTLDLHSNELTGTITHTFLSSMPKLAYLDLSSNRLKGKVPPEIVNPPMKFISLDGNLFTGSLPKIADASMTSTTTLFGRRSRVA